MSVGRVEEVSACGAVSTLYSEPRNGAEHKPEVIPWPEPLRAQAFHGVIGELVGAIEPHTEADVAAILLQSLAAFGNCIGRRAYFAVEADRHYPNLYVVLVGETSKGRKGTSLGHVRGVFRVVDAEWESARILSGLSSGEGVIWSVRDAIEKREAIREHRRVVDYQNVVEDPGIADKRALIVESEYASALKVTAREGNTLSPVIRDAWDHGNLRTLTKNSPARATNAHISIIGHITRSELLRELTATERANGFGNRHLWVCVRRSRILPEGGHIESVDFDLIIARIGQALEFAQSAGEVRRDRAAREMWRAVYPELSEGKPGLFGSIISRAEAQVVRLSLIYALLDRSAVIGPPHLEAALAVWDYCEASARYIFGDAMGHPEADTILAALRGSPDGLTRTGIAGLFGRNKPAAQIEGALRALEAMGRAKRHTERTGEAGGRPTERWTLLGAA